MFEFVKSLLKPGKYFLFINVIDRAASFLVFLILAKSLSPFIYGQIVTVFAATSIVAAVFDFGLPIYIQRQSAQSDNMQVVFLQTGLLKLLLSFVYLIVSLSIFLFFFKSIDWYVISIITGTVFFVSIGNSLQFYYHGKDNSRQVFISTLVTKVILLVIVSITFIVYPNEYLFLSGYFVANAFFVIHLLLRLKIYRIVISEITKGRDLLKSTFKTILPLGFASIFNILYDRIDVVLLSLLLNFNKVAQYNVAYMIYKLSVILFSVFFYPAFNRLIRINNDKVKLLTLLRKLSLLIIVSSLFLTIIFYFVVPGILVKVFGNKYVEASELLPVLSIAIILIGLNNLTGIFLNAVGKFKDNFWATLTGIIFNILSNIILIKRFDVYGAVYSTILTEGIILTLTFFSVYKFFRTKTNLDKNGYV